jgi:hypothetical protein
MTNVFVNRVSESPSRVSLPLAVFGNLIRGNMAAKAHVKASDHVKALIRTLIALLSNGDMALVLYSLRALTTLAVNDPLERKVSSFASFSFCICLRRTDVMCSTVFAMTYHSYLIHPISIKHFNWYSI